MCTLFFFFIFLAEGAGSGRMMKPGEKPLDI